jgi:hypothetical protein
MTMASWRKAFVTKGRFELLACACKPLAPPLVRLPFLWASDGSFLEPGVRSSPRAIGETVSSLEQRPPPKQGKKGFANQAWATLCGGGGCMLGAHATCRARQYTPTWGGAHPSPLLRLLVIQQPPRDSQAQEGRLTQGGLIDDSGAP